MTEKIELSAQIPDSLSNERLDQVAAQLFPDYSRSRLQTWIKKGELLVDGELKRPRDKVWAGAKLTVAAAPELAVSWQAQDIDLDVVYEDESILVLNKPAGLVVHPAAGHADGTLVNALLNHAPDMANLPRAGIVHRLDMDTSGIMVAAKTLAAHNHLVDQLQSRTVKTPVCGCLCWRYDWWWHSGRPNEPASEAAQENGGGQCRRKKCGDPLSGCQTVCSLYPDRGQPGDWQNAPDPCAYVAQALPPGR